MKVILEACRVHCKCDIYVFTSFITNGFFLMTQISPLVRKFDPTSWTKTQIFLRQKSWIHNVYLLDPHLEEIKHSRSI